MTGIRFDLIAAARTAPDPTSGPVDRLWHRMLDCGYPTAVVRRTVEHAAAGGWLTDACAAVTADDLATVVDAHRPGRTLR